MPLVERRQGRRAYFAVSGPDVEPPEWTRFAPPYQEIRPPSARQRRTYYAILAAELWHQKQVELSEGLDARGDALVPVKLPRKGTSDWHGRKYRKGTGPPLMPFRIDSRTRNLLRYRSNEREAVVYWAAIRAPGSPYTWPEILVFHAEGLVRGAPVRNVIGISPDGLLLAVDRAIKRYRIGSGPRKPELPTTSRAGARGRAAKRPEPGGDPFDVRFRRVGIIEQAGRTVMRIREAIPFGRPRPPKPPISQRVRETETFKRIQELQPDIQQIDQVKADLNTARNELAALRNLRRERPSPYKDPRYDHLTSDERWAITVQQNKEFDALKARVSRLEAGVEAARKAVADKLEAIWTDFPAEERIPLTTSLWAKKDEFRRLSDQARDWLQKRVRSPRKLKIRVFEDFSGRASFNDFPFPSIYVSELSGIRSYIHEITHGIELSSRRYWKASQEFRDERIAGRPPFKLKDRFPGDGYGDEETAYPGFEALKPEDPILGAYAAKKYKGKPTEVLTVGIELLYDEPETILANDPEYAAFIVSLLKGELR